MEQLSNLKAISKARDTEEKKMAERRKAVLVLILRHLVDSGYIESYERLSSDTNISLNKV